MTFIFPGWPGPINPRQRGLAPVAMPALPTVPIHPGGQPAGSPHPLAGLAAHGVPVGLSPNGQPVVRSGLNGVMSPPDIAGMPRMPGLPAGMLSGGLAGGGLFQPLTPVSPFNPGNQVQTLQAQQPSR